MVSENPGAYDEARKRIHENKERELIVIEEKKEQFEKSREKLYSRKKLDVFELKRRIETGQSLELLKSEIREAFSFGDISVDTYRDVLDRLNIREKKENTLPIPTYTVDQNVYPLAGHSLTKYFERQKLGENLFVDILGFIYGVGQGSLFLLWLIGRIILDALLLPMDVYHKIREN